MNSLDGPLPLVSVGIPTFNRPEGLRRTLRCITAQTYTNLDIIVSDNCSPDPAVTVVAREFCDSDPRVRYIRQDTNLGAWGNFRFVLRKASGKYFMWAADDDSWESPFIERLVSLLEHDANVGVAFSNFDARDRMGRRAKIYPDFLPLLQAFARKPTAQRLAAYIGQEEFHGKANLIYGLFRRKVLDLAGGVRNWGIGSWGADMLIACSVVAQADVAVADELLYHVGTEPLLESMPAPEHRALKRALPKWVRVIKAIGLHAGYAFGYCRIVSSAPGLSFAERRSLYRLLLRRLATLIGRDIANA